MPFKLRTRPLPPVVLIARPRLITPPPQPLLRTLMQILTRIRPFALRRQRLKPQLEMLVPPRPLPRRLISRLPILQCLKLLIMKSTRPPLLGRPYITGRPYRRLKIVNATPSGVSRLIPQPFP